MEEREERLRPAVLVLINGTSLISFFLRDRIGGLPMCSLQAIELSFHSCSVSKLFSSTEHVLVGRLSK